MESRPIGIFDSGVGGLTVVRTLIDRLPDENFIYFGDTAHVPYGTKTREQLFGYARDITDFLLSHQVKSIVVACGTHSSVTLPEMETTCPVPMVGVVRPGARAAVKTTRNGRIGVIATQASVNSGSYAKAIESINPGYSVYSAACSQFVPLVESGLLNSPATHQAVREYITPLLDEGIDTLVLGCTHYPFLAPVIEEFVGTDVILVDPAEETVTELADILTSQHLQNSGPRQYCNFYVSGKPENFLQLGRTLIGNVIEMVNKHSLDGDQPRVGFKGEKYAQHIG